MRRQEGIAIVSAIIIIAALVALGGGALFLSMTNLRIAQNTRTNVEAEHNAQSGLDLALISLARHFRVTEGGFPSLEELDQQVPSGGSFSVVRLEIDPGTDTGVVAVRGFGPSNAVHESSARFEGVVTPTEVETGTNPLFGEGLLTNADIEFPGNGEFNIDLWAGGNISLKGNSRLGGGYSAKAGGDTCEIGKGRWGTTCPTGVDPPDIPTFDFDAELQDLKDERPCDTIIESSGTVDLTGYQGQSVCLDDDVDVTLVGTATDVYVLGGRSTSATLNSDTEPPFGSGEDGVGIKLAAGTVDLTDESTSMSGRNTIFSANHVALKKDILDTQHGNSVSHTLIATEGDVRLNGGGNSDIVVATFWVNGAWCVNGTLNRFRGTVLAKDMDIGEKSGEACAHRGIRVNGSIDDASHPDANNNEDLPPEGTETTFDSAGIRVLARRP